MTKCGLVPELRLDRRDSPSQWQQRGGAGTSDQRIEEREREKGTKRAGGGSEFPTSSAGGKVREGEREAMGPRPRPTRRACGLLWREALLHCNKSGHVTRG